MSNLSARLTTRKMPHKDVRICLDLDLLQQRDEAMAKVSTSRKQGDDRMASPAVTTSVRVLEGIEKQIRDASITLRVVGADRHTYNQWVLQCPPRKGKQEPFNSEKFFVHAAQNSAVYVDESDVEHEISPEEWAEIDKMLTDGEHDRLAQAVLHVNRAVGAVDVGFFGNVSGMIRDSSETSDSRSESESRLAGSGAGSRKKSTSKTSTKKDAAE